MDDRLKCRIVIDKNFKTINGIFEGQKIYYCNGIIQTKLKTYFFGNNKKFSILNSKVKSIDLSTALKDKNNNLIYENDIIQDVSRHDKPLYIVKREFCSGGFQIEMINPNKYELYSKWHLNRSKYDYIKIGNIHENKELIGD